jgi:hypothetical protein
MGLLLLITVGPILLGIAVIIGIIMLVGTAINSTIDGAIEYSHDLTDEREKKRKAPPPADNRQVHIHHHYKE